MDGTPMIREASGNLLAAEAEALVNTVNTVGVMGKGIALQFRRAYPEMYAAYQREAKAGDVQLGHMSVWRTEALDGTAVGNETFTEMATRCQKLGAFATNTLDFLEPSAGIYYTPFVTGINAAERGRAEVIDFCTALSADWPQAVSDFVTSVHRSLGLHT